MDPVDGVITSAFFSSTNELSTKTSPSGLGWCIYGSSNLRIGTDPFDQSLFLEPIEQAAISVNVVVLQVDQRHPSIGHRQVITCPVLLDQVIFDDPVDLGIQLERIVGDGGQAVLPHVQRLLFHRAEFMVLGKPQGPLEVLALDLQCRRLAAIGQPDWAAAGYVVTDFANRPDWVVEGHISQNHTWVFEHSKQQ